MAVYIDANVFVLAASVDEKSKKALELFRLLQSGEEHAITSSLTFDEVMWALIKMGKREFVDGVVEGAYSLKNFQVVSVEPEIPLAAKELMKKHDLNPRDAFHLAVMMQHGIKTIISDDADFDRIKGIIRKF